MLSQEENELICRVGPGTPMGNLFREYWLPAMLSRRAARARQRSRARPDARRAADRLPRHQRQGRPAGRTTARTAARRCSSAATKRPACAASTTAGSSTSTATASTCPTSPPSRDFRTKVKAVAYPTQERGGIVWAYLARAQTPPPLPDLEGNMLPGAHGLGVPAAGQLVPDPRRPHRHRPRQLPALRRRQARGRAAGQLLRIPAAPALGPLRSHRHRRRRRLRRQSPGVPTARRTGASRSGSSRRFRWRRQACSAWASATPAKCRWTTTTPSPTRCR